MTTDTEYVVLCGDDHECIGYAPKALVHHESTPLHLAFSCYLFDVSGRFLVTRRAWEKRTWPGVRTNSCCGHPGPGERIEQAVARRLDQELGIVADRIDLVLPRFSYQATMSDGTRENEVCPVFRAVVTERKAAEPDSAEVAEAAWVPWTEFVAEALAEPESVSPWCALQVRELDALGPDPLRWPVSEDILLPAAVDSEPVRPAGQLTADPATGPDRTNKPDPA